MIQENKIVLTQEETDYFISLLTMGTGIIPRSSHRAGIQTYIEKKIAEKNISVSEFKLNLQSDKNLFTEFINESTVNETYFFREEKQFALLKERYFPMWKAMFPSVPIKIWSAACSYGEEAYSLAVLAKVCGIKAFVTASDINSEVLDHCNKGVFWESSIRSVDGFSFKNLLLPYKTNEGKIVFPDEIKSCIQTRKINLSKIDSPLGDANLPKNQNIIFIRNVFIYFSQELRIRILNSIIDKCLAEGGILFVSMSEIAQFDSNMLPPSLEKVMDGNIFYFKKKQGR